MYEHLEEYGFWIDDICDMPSWMGVNYVVVID